MERKLYKELWRLRFEKMLRLEEESIVDYENLLKDCRAHHKSETIELHLQRLIKDETKHAKLCRELLEILDRQSD